MVVLKNVTKKYGDLCVLDDLSLSLERGDWVTVMGASGSGKTTLLNLVSALDHPSSGEITVDGQDVTSFSESEACRFRREVTGFIFQKYHLVPYLSAVENVMLAQYFHSMQDEAEAKDALEKVGLAHRMHHLPSQLSGGEQQRVCIARALINSPSLLLADEPTGNLDRNNTEAVLNLLKSLHDEEQFTLVLVTHDPFVEQWTQRTVTLEDGRIVGDVPGPARGQKDETVAAPVAAT